MYVRAPIIHSFQALRRALELKVPSIRDLHSTCLHDALSGSSHALQSALQRKNYYPWEPAQNLGPNVNTPYFEGQPSISANGKTLYWDSVRPDGLGDFDIWMATRGNVGRDFGPAVNVGPEVNTVGPEFGAAISQNEKQLFFSSARPGNVGQVDIWVVERKDKSGPWGTPINLDTLNSPFFQAMPTFSRNGREVCFMAFQLNGFGNLDVWCADRLH